MLSCLPPELGRSIFESIDHRPTLCALLLTSHQIWAIVEPVLYQDVVIEPATDRRPRLYIEHRLAAFYRSISLDGCRRCSYVKRLSILFHSNWITISHCSQITDILQRLGNLEYLRLSNAYISHSYSGVRIALQIFNSPRIPSSLKRLDWRCAQAIDEGAFASFLRSQKSLEHLSLDWGFTVPHLSNDALPHLKILCASPESASRILPGRNVTHLRRSCYPNRLPDFSDTADEGITTVRTLALIGVDWETVIRIVSHHIDLEYLELTGLEFGADEASRIDGLQSTRIRFIRFREASSRQIEPLIPSFFKSLPHLHCIECIKSCHCNRKSHEQCEKYSWRWYRDTSLPASVIWMCPTNEEWWHDWEKDVRIIEKDVLVERDVAIGERGEMRDASRLSPKAL